MKRDTAKAELAKLSYLLDSFECDSGCMDELVGQFNKHGNNSRFLSVLKTRLEQLQQYGAYATDVFPSRMFEILEHGSSGICSMHIVTTEVNYRILYSVLCTGTILLLGFDKKSGKSKTDYQDHLPKAKQRLCTWKEKNHG